jgi:hypothetical protein
VRNAGFLHIILVNKTRAAQMSYVSNLPNIAPLQPPKAPPKMPCETCGFWSVMCDQSKCPEFVAYKQEIEKLGLGSH